jgi:DNA-binding transcriptional MerR regulator
MEKSPDAFRTISEVADWLGVPTHVLRFWESRFPQVKPVKRAGGRRYYRPADMMLLGGIKTLLHDDGLTIRGVQKMLREEGVRHVSSFSQPLDAVFPLRDVTPAEEEVAPGPMALDVEPEPLDNVVPMTAAAPGMPAAPDEEVSSPTPEQERLVLAGQVPDHDSAAEDRHAPPEEPQPEADVATAEDEKLPEFSFLRRGHVASEEPSSPADASQPDLFATRRAPEPPDVPRPRIPATPEVPATDAADDDAATPAFPGLAARLLAGRVRVDHAAIARAAADLRALRARL